MAIETPTSPSSIPTTSAVALKPTINNKAFSINSGLIAADNTETTIISVNSIGPRDIILFLNPILTSGSPDDMRMKIKNNGSIIYECVYTYQYGGNITQSLSFIIPANTSLEVTFTNVDSTSHNVGISAYGYYMESEII